MANDTTPALAWYQRIHWGALWTALLPALSALIAFILQQNPDGITIGSLTLPWSVLLPILGMLGINAARYPIPDKRLPPLLRTGDGTADRTPRAKNQSGRIIMKTLFILLAITAALFALLAVTPAFALTPVTDVETGYAPPLHKAGASPSPLSLDLSLYNINAGYQCPLNQFGGRNAQFAGVVEYMPLSLSYATGVSDTSGIDRLSLSVGCTVADGEDRLRPAAWIEVSKFGAVGIGAPLPGQTQPVIIVSSSRALDILGSLFGKKQWTKRLL